MPAKAAEIYTYPPDAQTENALNARRGCLCRFRGAGQLCDQSEHRGNKAFVQLTSDARLREKYAGDQIPLGLCSIWSIKRSTREPWIVCPHRLFYAGPQTTTVDNWIYQAWGLARGDRVALWKEVKITKRQRNKRFDFTFDYVFRKVRSEDPLVCEEVPYLVEVMTASTAGGQVEKTFLNALLDPDAQTETSINYRQVVARMMSQFIAKAQAASEWGGKAVWIVQDLLWRYIERTTGFSQDSLYRDPRGNVVVLVRGLVTEGYEPTNPAADSYNLTLSDLITGWDRYERRVGESHVGSDFVSMLNAPFIPEREVILRATNRPPVGLLVCA